MPWRSPKSGQLSARTVLETLGNLGKRFNSFPSTSSSCLPWYLSLCDCERVPVVESSSSLIPVGL